MFWRICSLLTVCCTRRGTGAAAQCHVSDTAWAAQDTNEPAAQPLATCAANCGRHLAPRAGLILQPEICKNQSPFCRPKTVCRACQGGTLWVRAAAPWPHKTQMNRLPSPWPLAQRTAAGTQLHARASFCSQKSAKIKVRSVDPKLSVVHARVARCGCARRLPGRTRHK